MGATPDAVALDLPAILVALSRERPVFHSEADFQHALAWAIQRRHPDAVIRLETRPERGIHLDLLVVVDGQRTAIELKYMPARLSTTVQGEDFELPNRGAQDLARYDVCKDIWRIETMIADRYADCGWVVALTNDSTYWRPGARPDPIDAAFRLHEGRTLHGRLSWHERTGGTSRGRERVLPLRGSYECHWARYSGLGQGQGSRSVEFQYLALAVGPAPTA